MSVTCGQCDSRPSYLPIRNSHHPLAWYQIILLGDRGTCVLITCPGLHSIAGRSAFKPATYVDRKSIVTVTGHRATHTVLLASVKISIS